jgi:transcriptional repressor NrdR
MRCPKCGSKDDKVIDSRQSRDSSSIRRRRVCLACKYRFTTYEQIERSDLRVIKRDRTHEPFDRRKLVSSIAKACEKRSINLTATNGRRHHARLETSGREVTWPRSAKRCWRVARTRRSGVSRYASVHRPEGVDQFVDEIQALGRRIKPNASQPELFNEP